MCEEVVLPQMTVCDGSRYKGKAKSSLYQKKGGLDSLKSVSKVSLLWLRSNMRLLKAAWECLVLVSLL